MKVSNQETHCLLCDRSMTNKRRKFCSTKCKNNYHQNNCYQKQQERARIRKEVFIVRAGGSCEICGYNKNTAALSFHHKNPTEKSFPLDYRHLSNRTMKTLESEFEKCSLLCLNCHAELHHPKHNKL